MSQSTTSLFRRLAWQSSVTLEIRFAEDGPGGGGVPEVYYVSRVASDSEQGKRIWEGNTNDRCKSHDILTYHS
jgi:hypothetical protein